MQHKQKQKKDNSERWLLTYSDLITLLMILFILLFAISNVNQSKYDQLAEALSESMGEGASIFNGSAGVIQDGGGNNVIDIGSPDGDGSGSGDQEPSGTTGSPTPTPTGAASESLETEKDMEELQSDINQVLDDMDVGMNAGTHMIEKGLTVTFTNDIFFDSGKDVLKEEMKHGLSKIAKLLNRVDNKIIIEGHTDNVPIRDTNKYTSNWQLSAARAANVVEYLVDHEKVDGTRISAVGYGEYSPVASNDTAEGRSQNRRVDIIILYDGQ